MPDSPAVFAALDRTIQYAVADDAALLIARDAWHLLAGKVHDDEPLYEERAGAFLEWYALEHWAQVPGAPETNGGRGLPPPVERLMAERKRAGAPAVEIAALTALAASHRSLFRVREITRDGTGDHLVLDDLWGGGVFRARERRNLAGLSAGDLVDARVVADVDAAPELLLTRIVCVHPREAETAIRDHVESAKKTGKSRNDLLFFLLRLRVRCERYQYVAPVRIYTAGETFRER